MTSLSPPALAAEVRGAVPVRHSALFGAGGVVPEDATVSVALFPAEGRPLSWGAATGHGILLHNGRIEPLYTALSGGDRVHFRNQGGVYHELFAHSQTQPIEVHTATR